MLAKKRLGRGRIIRITIVAGVMLAFISGAPGFLRAENGKAAPAAASKKKGEAKKPLTGAELYAIHCNRCHAERYPTEWTSREWQTIMAQMRVRANLPAAQYKEILKYLKEESGAN